MELLSVGKLLETCLLGFWKHLPLKSLCGIFAGDSHGFTAGAIVGEQ